MLPIARPLTDAQGSANRIAGLVLELEENPFATLALTTIAVRELGGRVQGWVIAHLADGRRERFTIDDARLAAAAVRDAAGAVRQLGGWAESLDAAAEAAARQASAILLGLGTGR
ncbi:MAG: hypothetical protein JF588_19270 [Caulobacterales bacterium]|nr:hypothetical protein [Caulobacterales bacterium]